MIAGVGALHQGVRGQGLRVKTAEEEWSRVLSSVKQLRPHPRPYEHRHTQPLDQGAHTSVLIACCLV